MNKKEVFRLDATLGDMIDDATFSAELPNGHRMVAYSRSSDKERVSRILRPGDRVRVVMSPYDMSRGCIDLEGDEDHES